MDDVIYFALGLALLWVWLEVRQYTNIPPDDAPISKLSEDKQREKDIADLKKQGYTDELIAVILPVINDGQ